MKNLQNRQNQYTLSAAVPVGRLDPRVKPIASLKAADGMVLLMRCNGYRPMVMRIGRRDWYKGKIRRWAPLKLPPTHWMHLPRSIEGPAARLGPYWPGVAG